jgi:hypothetical protein
MGRPRLGDAGLNNCAAALRDREFATAVRNVSFLTILAIPLER